jgi:beta-glucanase (GH16 family)
VVTTRSARRRGRAALLVVILPAVLLILTADGLGRPPAPPTPSPVGPAGSWALAFNDDFNGTAVDWTRWADSSSAEADQGHGNKGNQQLEWNQGANCTVSNGVLHMTAKRENHGSYTWTSCLITSTPSYSFQYGYIEERAQLPAAKGFWPAFWTWSTGHTYIETDAYEFQSDNHRRLHLTQHSGRGGGCTVELGFDPTAGMHVYGVDIEPTGTTWYLDGDAVCSKPGTSPGKTALISDNFVYSAVPPDPGTTSARKDVDYIRAYVSRPPAPGP